MQQVAADARADRSRRHRAADPLLPRRSAAAELDAALRTLDIEPWELARLHEPLARESGLADLPRDGSARDRWLATMSANPKLIERPVVITDNGRAIIGRPPENVDELL